jgi:hypothetical protein
MSKLIETFFPFIFVQVSVTTLNVIMYFKYNSSHERPDWATLLSGTLLVSSINFKRNSATRLLNIIQWYFHRKIYKRFDLLADIFLHYEQYSFALRQTSVDKVQLERLVERIRGIDKDNFYPDVGAIITEFQPLLYGSILSLRTIYLQCGFFIVNSLVFGFTWTGTNYIMFNLTISMLNYNLRTTAQKTSIVTLLYYAVTTVISVAETGFLNFLGPGSLLLIVVLYILPKKVKYIAYILFTGILIEFSFIKLGN